MTFTFSLADKQRLDPVLPQVFRILHTNMSAIAPTGDTYEQDLAVWSQYIAPAMQEAGRQMILMFCGEELSGYFQYSVRTDLLMMEEIQIDPKYQGTGLFRELYRWLESVVPADLTYVEAYSHKQNLKSQAILEHLGLRRIGENKSGSSYHYRGSCQALWEKFR